MSQKHTCGTPGTDCRALGPCVGSDEVSIKALAKMPEGRPLGHVVMHRDMFGAQLPAIRWMFTDSYARTVRRAYFDAATGEYLGDI